MPAQMAKEKIRRTTFAPLERRPYTLNGSDKGFAMHTRAQTAHLLRAGLECGCCHELGWKVTVLNKSVEVRYIRQRMYHRTVVETIPPSPP